MYINSNLQTLNLQLDSANASALEHFIDTIIPLIIQNSHLEIDNKFSPYIGKIYEKSETS